MKPNGLTSALEDFEDRHQPCNTLTDHNLAIVLEDYTKFPRETNRQRETDELESRAKAIRAKLE